MDVPLKSFSCLKRLKLIRMVYMRRQRLLHVPPDRQSTGPGWLLPILANLQWVAGTATALGSLLVVASLIEPGETMARSAFFVLETRFGQYAVVIAGVVWAGLVVRTEIASIRGQQSH